MRKAFLVVIAGICALAWISRGQAAYAGTMSCQGHDLVLIAPCVLSPTSVSASNVCDDSWGGFFNISDAAIWSVTTQGGKLTGGTLLATYQEGPGETFTCSYQLDAKNSTLFTDNGILIQGLEWLAQAPCDMDFFDYVFTLSSGSVGVMNDVNLDGDEAA